MGQPLNPSSGYMWQLDTLRAVAAGMVIVSHWVPGTDTFWFNGHVGVQLFFVISGFLITGILLDARKNADRRGIRRGVVIRHFYVRRLLRIFPLYYGTLALTYMVGVPAVRTSIQWHLPYLSNVFFAMRGEWYGEVAHFWSLAVEEQFYCLWPWLIMFAPQRLLLPLVLAGMLSAPLFRWIAGQVVGINEIAVMVMPLASLDTLGIGALFALLQRREDRSHNPGAPATRLAWWVGIGGVTGFTTAHLIARALGSQGVIRALGDCMLAPAALGLVYMTARGIDGPLGRLLRWGPLVYLGKISYGLYVLHFFVPMMTRRVLAWGGVSMIGTTWPIAFFVLNLFVLVILSSLSWHFFETKINDFKRCFPYMPPERPRGTFATPASGSPDAQDTPREATWDRTTAR
jgi:peptidoglycan/LPS O-acetylase OafA/YrhL